MEIKWTFNKNNKKTTENNSWKCHWAWTVEFQCHFGNPSLTHDVTQNDPVFRSVSGFYLIWTEQEQNQKHTANHSWSGNSQRKTNETEHKPPEERKKSKKRTSQPNRIKSSLTKRYSVATWEKDNSNIPTHLHLHICEHANSETETMLYP